jgi:protein-disulfide isomerase
MWNRVNIVLSFIGVFVAGFLSLTHMLDVSIPCGIAHGCDVVARHPSSKWFGIPVAYLGLAMYVTLLTMAVWRLYAGQALAKLLARLGLGISALGAIISIGLQIYAATSIGEWCTWCIGSAIVVSALFLGHALEAQTDRPAARIAKGVADATLVALFGVALVGALVYSSSTLEGGRTLKADMSKLKNPIEELAPADSHFMGRADAPLVIVEFADLNCAQCKRAQPLLKEILARSRDQAKVVFRHFPLIETKPFSIHAAILSEFAAEHGKFWEFVDQVFQLDPEAIKSVDPYFSVLGGLGLDVAEARRTLEDVDSPAWNRVYRDRKLADTLGLAHTPSFFIFAPGVDPVAVSYSGLVPTLNEPRFAKVVKNARGK